MENESSSFSLEEISAAPERKWYAHKPMMAALLVLIFLSGLGSGYLLWGISPDQSANDERSLTDLIIGDDPTRGPQDAPITIVEFSDYECPYCIKWHQEVWPALEAAYPDQIRFIYRDFPLTSIHANALMAGEAANCAGEQEKYWKYHDLLFSNQKQLGIETFQDYAAQLNLDSQKFLECLTSERYREEIKGDFEDAVTLGINGTPTFFIDEYRLVGAQPFEAFQQVIEAKLNSEQP